MRLDISHEAFQDVGRIHKIGVEKFGQLVADEYSFELFDKMDLLVNMPQMARERTEFKDGIRILNVNSHAIFYRIYPDRVFILRILHGRQDWNAVFQTTTP